MKNIYIKINGKYIPIEKATGNKINFVDYYSSIMYSIFRNNGLAKNV